MEKTIELVKKKKISEPIQTPKTSILSKKIINLIINNLKNNLYHFVFKEENVVIYDENNNIINCDIIQPNVNHNLISKIIAVFINKYHFNFDIKYACLENEIGNPVLYVFLMPFVSIDNYYIIKVGYTKDINQRHQELKKEFGIDSIYLLYIKKITGEHIELNIHKNLKNNFTTNVFRMKKNKNIENSSISEETYKFSWILFKNIFIIIYKTIIMNNKIKILNKENEKIKLENEGKLLDIKLKELENEKIKLENEKIKLENEGKLLDVKLKEFENERTKLNK